MIVFDFDKTITKFDTLTGFYAQCVHDRSFSTLRRACYFWVQCFYKVGLINNRRLKEAGVLLFLKGLSCDVLLQKSVEYGKKIEINELCKPLLAKYSKESEVIVMTASYDCYVREAMESFGWTVFGAELKFGGNGEVVGLRKNLFGQEKADFLEKHMKISRIEAVITDSYSDQPLIDIAENAFLVGPNRVEKIK